MQPPTPVFAQQLQHKSVRKFLDVPVSPEQLTQIVTAAQRASSSSNMQVWSVIAVIDGERKQRLASALGGQSYVASAAVFLVWVADLARNAAIIHANGADPAALANQEVTLMGALDVGIAAQNALLAAESMGLGGVFVGGIRNAPEAVVAELGLPQHVFPIVGMALGVPDPSEGTGLRPRLPLRAVLHHEQYDDAQWESAVAEYEPEYEAYFAGQGHPGRSWVKTVVARLGSLAGLHGRHTMRDSLAKQGFRGE